MLAASPVAELAGESQAVADAGQPIPAHTSASGSRGRRGGGGGAGGRHRGIDVQEPMNASGGYANEVAKGDRETQSSMVQGLQGSAAGADMSAASSQQGVNNISGSNMNKGTKGTSANHLLGFRYEQPTPSGRGGGRGGGGGHHHHHGSAGGGRRYQNASYAPRKHVSPLYDRNKFLQANYRFLVSDAVDLQAHARDPDRMFDWDDVLQVELLSGAPLQCPISLDSPPQCPQITPCGHIFAFVSIQQHLMTVGKAAPCPLCFTPVVARELRLVRHTRITPPTVGTNLSFQLLKRRRESIIPQLAGQPTSTLSQPATAGGSASNGTSSSASSSSCNSAALFAKFSTVDLAGALSLWREAARELATYAEELTREGGLEAAHQAPVVYAALDTLAARARRWSQHRAEAQAAKGSDEDPEAVGLAAEAEVKKMFTAAVEDVRTHHIQQAGKAALEAQFPGLPTPAGPPRTGSGTSSTSTTAGTTTGGKDRAAPNAPPSTSQPSSQSPKTASSSKAAGLSVAAAPFVPGQPPGPAQRDRRGSVGEGKPAASTVPAGEVEELSFEETFQHSDDEGQEAVPSTSTGGAAAADAGGQVAAGLPDSSSEQVLGTSCTSDDTSHLLGTSLSGMPRSEGQQIPAGKPGNTKHPQDSNTDASGDSLLGTSPTSISTAKAVNGAPGGDVFCYQAVDGQWIFLDPLCVRILLAHYGSYEACPSIITAPVLDLETVEQSEATRRRWRFLGHLPLQGTFSLAEVQLAGLLPPESLAPFQDDLVARERRRSRRAAAARRQAAAEAAAARAAEASRRGPSAAELASMPALGATGGPSGAKPSPAAAALAAGMGPTRADAEALAAARELGFASAEDLAYSMALQASLDEASASGRGSTGSNSGAGVSFARIAKLGYAATGPALPTRQDSQVPSSPPVPVSPIGAWAARGAGTGAGASKPAVASPWGPITGSTAPSLASSLQRQGSTSVAWGTTAGKSAGGGVSSSVASVSGGASQGATEQGAAAAAGPEAQQGPSSSSSSKKKPQKLVLFSTSQRKY